MQRLKFGFNDLKQVDQVISQAQSRAKSRRNYDVDRIADLGIEYSDNHPQLENGGYIATKIRDSKRQPLALSQSAVAGACRLLGVKKDFFKGFEDKNAFPKMLVNKLDNPNREGQHTFKIRTGLSTDNGISEVLSAILPGNYQIRDAHEQLSTFAQLVHENVGPIRGINVQEQGFGDHLSYKLVIGGNIMKSIQEDLGQFMMFNLSMSEVGLASDTTTLGMYRLVCMNGAVAGSGRLMAKWSHNSPSNDYLSKTGKTLHMASHLSKTWGNIFSDMNQSRLEQPVMDYLHIMDEEEMITNSHYESTVIHAKSGNEPDKTQYDLFNLLTRGAQDLPNIRQRQTAEQQSLKIFTSPGGFIKQIERAKVNSTIESQDETGDVSGDVTPQSFADHLNGLMSQ